MPATEEMLMRLFEAYKVGIVKEIDRIKEIQESNHTEIMDMFKKAFPDGDLAGHQKFHQQLIDDAKTRREIRNEILKKLAAGSAWSLVVFLAYRGFDIMKAYFHVH